jgi:hypothetical protein
MTVGVSDEEPAETMTVGVSDEEPADTMTVELWEIFYKRMQHCMRHACGRRRAHA